MLYPQLSNSNNSPMEPQTTNTKTDEKEEDLFPAFHPPALAGSQTDGLCVALELGRNAHFQPRVSNLCFIGPPGGSGHAQVWELRVPRMVDKKSQELLRISHGTERRAQRTGGFFSRLYVWQGKRRWASSEKRNTPRDTDLSSHGKHFNDSWHHRYK